MATTVWKGHLTFGLVSIPVRLVRAARAERVKLRQLYRPKETQQPDELGPSVAPLINLGRDNEVQLQTPRELAAKIAPLITPAIEPAPVVPVRRVFEAGNENAPVAPADLVKGYEYEKGQYVVLEQEDLRALAHQTSTEIQIVEFVRFMEIDPVYLETSYYVIPDENAEKAYALLLEAMRETGYAAVGQLTMHRRDHVIILRPGKRGLIGHTMFYPDEVRASEEFRTDTSLMAEKELGLAKALIVALAKPFDPAQFKNTFREQLRGLIESRVAGRQVTRIESREPAKVIDIMDALKRSLAQATEKQPAANIIQAERKPASAAKSSSRSGKSKKSRSAASK
jgi:DNA end-binding protein Ku